MTAKQNKTLAAIRTAFGSSEFMFNFRYEYAHAGSASVTDITSRAFVKLQNAGLVVGGSNLLTYRLA